MQRPKLLVVSPTYPYPLVAGGKLRIFNILRGLSRRIDITLLTLAEPNDDIQETREALSFVRKLIAVPIQQTRLRQFSRLLLNAPRWFFGTPAEALVKHSPAMIRRFQQLIEEERFDVVQIEYSQLIPYLTLAKHAGLNSILVAHDISYISQTRKAEVAHGPARWFWAREAKLMKDWERKGWRDADVVVTMSETDRDIIKKQMPSVTVDVVPNGADTDRLRPVGKSSAPTLVFVGWMRHLPNRDAIEWFMSEIWPLIRKRHADVRMQIVGRGLPEGLRPRIEADDRVDYLGYVEEIDEVVGAAWISVVPIRIGSGSRLKILESMALGTPVISTTVGCEGIDAKPGGHVLFADLPIKFAEAILELLGDKRRRDELSQNARRLVEERYGWARIGGLAAESVSRLIATRRE